MSDLIGREALLEKMNKRLDDLRKKHGQYDHYTDGFDDAVDMVMDFPAAEAEPVRHGEWKWVFNRKADTWGDDCYESGWECSECGAGADIYISHYKVEESCEESEKGITDERTIYCPNCGANMDGGMDNGKAD